MVRRKGASGAIHKQRSHRSAATIRPFCGVGSLADQEVVPIFAGLDLGAKPERHATAAGPDLVGVLRVAVFHRDGPGLGVSAAAPSRRSATFVAIMASTSARRLSSLPVGIFSNVIAISHRSYEERRG
jgi:hypothetical protein